MIIRKSVVGMACVLVLSSCQPANYVLKPLVQNGHLFFDAEFSGFLFLRERKDQTEADYLEVVTSKEILWAISAKETRDCTKATQNPSYREPTFLTFPIPYGEIPRCYIELMAPKPLPSGTTILVRSGGYLREGGLLFQLQSGEVHQISDGTPYDAGVMQFHAPTLNQSGRWFEAPHFEADQNASSASHN